MMTRLTVAALLIAVAGTASAQTAHPVRGYLRSDGTYVAPHMETDRNATRMDNWSTRGNVNPYTGQQGTVDPYRPTASNPYQAAKPTSPYKPPY